MRTFLLFLILISSQPKFLSQAIYTKAFFNSNIGIGKNIVVINNKYHYNFYGTIAKTLDNKIAGFNSDAAGYCDMYYPTQNNYFFKNDTNGSFIFGNTQVVNFGDEYKTLVQLGDSTYCLFTDSVMFRYSKTGAFLSRLNTGLHGISSSVLLQNNTFLLSAMNGNVATLTQITGTAQTSQPVSLLFDKMTLYNGQQVMGLSAGQLHKFSAALVNIGSSNTGLVDFICENDSIYAIGSTSYLRMDTSFNVVSSTSVLTQGVVQKAMQKNGDNIAILSRCRANIEQNIPAIQSTDFSANSGSFYLMNKLSKHEYKYDIEVTSATPDVYYLDRYSDPSPMCCISYRINLKAKVKIKNKGNFPINQFQLTCVTDKRVDCGYHYFYKLYAGLNLLPGDSVEVFTDTLRRYGTIIGNLPTVDTKFCFFATSPNGEIDKVLANNESCNTYPNLVTAIPSFDNLVGDFMFFPNPFNSELKIESGIEIKKMSMYNTLGELIYSQSVNDFKLSYKNEGLSPGFYLIKIETEKGTVTKKVLKN